MDISYNELKSKEIVNLTDGRKLGHVIDILFDSSSGKVNGVLVPGERKIFHKNEDVFVPLEKIRKIGDDVILIRIDNFYGMSQNRFVDGGTNKNYGVTKSGEQVAYNSYVRFRRLDNKKYK